MQVQLPNEQDFYEMDIDLTYFKQESIIGNITYGWYKESYIAIKNLKQ